jgi:hypothetical protein
MYALVALVAFASPGSADDCTKPAARQIVIDALSGRVDGLLPWYRGNGPILIRLVHADFRAQNYAVTVDNREGVSHFYSVIGATGGGVNALVGSQASSGASLSPGDRRYFLGQLATRKPGDPLDATFDEFLRARRALVDLHLQAGRAASRLTGTLDPRLVFACDSGRPVWAAGLTDTLRTYWETENAVQKGVAAWEESLLKAQAPRPRILPPRR